MPITNNSQGYHYFDIGHDTPSIVWFMDKGLIVHSVPNEKEKFHKTWRKLKRFDKIKRVAAHGRYVPKYDITSLFIHDFDIMEEHKGRYMENKIERILDKEFDNPRIIIFHDTFYYELV